jgi:hypothetical protein
MDVTPCSTYPPTRRKLSGDLCTQAHAIAAQPGRHLDVPDALLDMVKTYARRAAEVDEPLKAFMCVIPKVRAYGKADSVENA